MPLKKRKSFSYFSDLEQTSNERSDTAIETNKSPNDAIRGDAGNIRIPTKIRKEASRSGAAADTRTPTKGRYQASRGGYAGDTRTPTKGCKEASHSGVGDDAKTPTKRKKLSDDGDGDTVSRLPCSVDSVTHRGHCSHDSVSVVRQTPHSNDSVDVHQHPSSPPSSNPLRAKYLRSRFRDTITRAHETMGIDTEAEEQERKAKIEEERRRQREALQKMEEEARPFDDNEKVMQDFYDLIGKK